MSDYPYHNEQARYDAMRQSQEAAERERLQQQNAEAKRLNELDRERVADEQHKREAAANAERDAQFKASVRATMPAMDDAAFESAWPRLRIDAMEAQSQRLLDEKRAMAAEYL